MSNELYFSVIMPTLNSESTIDKALASIRAQVFDQSRIEILVLDGGSKDTTLEIAKKYGCKVIENKKIQQEYAKHLGILNSQGKVCLFLDSDEVLEDVYSFQKRENIFEDCNNVKIILFGGYKKPENTSMINDYINYFSDPFSFFISGNSTEYRVIHSVWKKKLRHFQDRQNHTLFQVNKSDYLPPVDMCAGNCFLRHYYLNLVKDEINNPMLVPGIFYNIVRSVGCFAMLKDSPTVHYSADSFKKYIKKLDWRVKVNIHFKDIPGTGFSNRESFQPASYRLMKYLFLLYALTLIIPLIQGIHYFLVYKNVVMLLHPVISFFVAITIIYYYMLKILGIKPILKTYGSNLKVLDV